MTFSPARTSSIGLPPSVSPKFRCSGRGAISAAMSGVSPYSKNAGDEVREAVQHVLAVDARVRRQAAVADQALQPRLPRADQPGVRRTHRVAVAAELSAWTSGRLTR